MADTKISALTSATPVLTDQTVIVDDPGGTPSSKRITLQQAMDLFEANFAAPASAISSGTFADARIAESNVTQHQAALSVTESQISDLGTYSTATGVENNADVTDEANVTAALDGATLTDLGTPASGDLILLQDASDSSNLKVAQFSTFGGAGAGDLWGDAVDADIVPDGDGTRDLGSGVNRFANLHVDSIDLNGTTLDGTTLADPGADRLLFWDDSASTTAYLTVGSGLTITGTTITSSGGGDVVDDTTPQLGGDLDGQGNTISNYLNSVVTAVTGTLTTAAHAGNVLVTSGNITVPTTAGFSCVIIAGGAHTVTFNSTTSAAMATGDIMTVAVESGTVIHAVLTQAADKVSFT